MAGSYKQKTQGDNAALANLTSATAVHVDGGVTTPVSLVPAGTGCRLLRVILNTNGAVLRIRTGSRVIAVIATDAPEQTFDYGTYLEDGLIYEASGAMSATIVYGR
jgi:hypothetical protein